MTLPLATHMNDADAWTSLWRTGTLHSCSTGIAGNYDGAIADFWRQQFNRMGSGDRLVDIGTGNGALPLLAKQDALQRGVHLDIHGVDTAAIDPPNWVDGGPSLFAGIIFHPGISAANLPFADGSVSLLTSQYAFEYCRPREATLTELFRVIGMRGRAALIMHSNDSLIARTADLQIDACSFLFRDNRILELAAGIVERMSEARTQLQRMELSKNPEAQIARDSFNAASQQIVDRIDQHPDAVILQKAAHYVFNALRRAQRDPNDALKYLHSAEEDLLNEQARLKHLKQAIMTHDELLALLDSCMNAGYSQTVLAPVEQDHGVRMGWTLVISNV